MIASATSNWGLNGEERAVLLRVKTGPECPEGNQRELTRDSNLNCGMHYPTRSQNKGLSKYQRRANRLWTGPSPARGRRHGGGERGKFGPREGIPYQTVNRFPVSNQTS